MKHLRAFGRFSWDFVIGDDWRVAVAVAGALVLTWLLEHEGIAAWWVLPPAVALIFAESVHRETRRS